MHGQAQHRPLDVPDPTHSDAPPTRTRLILRDGGYQMVLSYKVEGKIVRYRSAERNGASEEIPLSLVDLPATEKWAHDHDPLKQQEDAARPPVLSPELQKEEAERASRTPLVAPDLRLPEEDSVLVLDTFQGTPEVVPVPQEGGDLNKETAHNVQKGVVNPASSPHRIADVPGEKSDIQLHVSDPVFYVRVGSDDAGVRDGGGFTVDTGGASGRATPSGGNPNNGYVLERLDVRHDLRVVDSFRISQLGVRPQRDVVELKSELMPGGHWLKLTPVQPLEFGEYALVEILSDREVNLSVWTFGVHPTDPENVEALRPEPKRPAKLERRRP
ncbi:MAG TPA: hypothetical protein VGN16_01695 [Acidobacteriaceae bacterium]